MDIPAFQPLFDGENPSTSNHLPMEAQGIALKAFQSGATATRPIEALTPREVEVMVAFIPPSATFKSVAEQFNVSQRTIEAHVHNTRSKLDCMGITMRELMCKFVQFYPDYKEQVISYYI